MLPTILPEFTDFTGNASPQRASGPLQLSPYIQSGATNTISCRLADGVGWARHGILLGLRNSLRECCAANDLLERLSPALNTVTPQFLLTRHSRRPCSVQLPRTWILVWSARIMDDLAFLQKMSDQYTGGADSRGPVVTWPWAVASKDSTGSRRAIPSQHLMLFLSAATTSAALVES